MHLHHAQANRQHNTNKQASPNTDKMRSFFLFALLVAAASAFVAPANKAVGKSLFSVLARLLRSRARGRPTGQLLPGGIVLRSPVASRHRHGSSPACAGMALLFYDVLMSGPFSSCTKKSRNETLSHHPKFCNVPILTHPPTQPCQDALHQ